MRQDEMYLNIVLPVTYTRPDTRTTPPITFTNKTARLLFSGMESSVVDGGVA